MDTTNTTPTPYIAPGGHAAGGQRCVNEWLAFLAGEPHSDTPNCVSPVVQRYMMRLNDRLRDEPRQRLAPYTLRALGTAGDGRDDERVAMCREHVISHLAKSLDAIDLGDLAQRVRDMPGLLAGKAARDLMYECRDAAWEVRKAQRAKLRDAILQRLKDGRAVAVAGADAAAVAGAAAVAAAAAVAVADAAADAAAVADAAADAAAAAAADAAADAAAAAAAAADADDRYWQIRDAVYKALRIKYQPLIDAATDEAFSLLDRMLPEQPVLLPVPEAREVAAAFAAVSA